MLQKTTRKKLNEQNWLEIKERDPNIYQFLKRVKRQSNEAMDDLSLIAKKLPDDSVDEIFTTKKLETFILDILQLGPFWNGKISSRDSTKRRTQIAAMLVEKSIDFCISQYDSLLSESPALTGPIIRQLRESIEICNDIARKLELEDLRIEEKKKKLDYVFNWDNISVSDNTRLAKYLADESGSPYDLLDITKSTNNRTLSCSLGLPDFDGGLNVEIKISPDEQSAEVIFTDVHDIEVLKKSKLTIKKLLNHRYLYKNRD